MVKYNNDLTILTDRSHYYVLYFILFFQLISVFGDTLYPNLKEKNGKFLKTEIVEKFDKFSYFSPIYQQGRDIYFFEFVRLFCKHLVEKLYLSINIKETLTVIEIRVRNLQDRIHENFIFSLDCITKFTKIYMTEVIFTGHGLSVLC